MLSSFAVAFVIPHLAVVAEDGSHRLVRSEFREGIVKVEADGASVSDIIDSIARTLGFDVRGDVPNEDLRVTRTLEGTLDDLLAMLLRETNYLLVMDAGAPKRLIILPAGTAVAQPLGVLSVEELRQKEGELVAQIAQYEDLTQEARERSKPDLARKFERYLSELSAKMQAIRARIPR
ncbi:MAG: hypothetical protein J2P50_01140 [Hyphomicrobiaceae bacterium]|nr:hypothetical protein [Hyphomicrobiaceae bacterium]